MEFHDRMFTGTLENPVQITEEARRQILTTLTVNKIPAAYGLRVGIRGGGCGSSWLLGFDQPGPSDQVYEIDGVRVIIDNKHLLYVFGTEVGYEVGEESRGFTIQKPSELSGSKNG